MNTHLELKQHAATFFKKHRFVSCPAFPKEKIAFNSKGLSHIFYKGAGKISSRSMQESEVRVKLLPRALEVLKRMPLSQEESAVIDRAGRVCRYWAFEAIVDNRRIKVIVRQVGNGKKHFWSVIPAWRRIRGQVVNAKGNLSDP